MSVTVIEDNSDKVAEELRARINKALEICGLTAENYAKKLCTVDTGLLRNSITHALAGEPAAISTYSADKAKGNKPVQTGEYSDSAPEESDPSKMAVYIGTNVEYAPYVELGTVAQQAKPFLKPAAADHASQYRGTIEQVLKGEL